MTGQIYAVTTVTLNRIPWFTDFDVAAAAARSFHRRDLLGHHALLAWVLMPDHAHWLVQLNDDEPLAEVVNRMKSSSAREVNRCLLRRGPLWAPAYHDHAVRSGEALSSVADYIIGNPLRAGLVSRLGQYPFWDSAWLPDVT